MIHYHGTPFTPRSALHQLAGKHFCVSFAEPRDAAVCLSLGQSVMWDNGAFTSFTQGKKLDRHEFYGWLEPKLGGENWAVIPDVIDGSVEDQAELIGEWPYPKVAGAPVWHTALPITYLLQLADQGWPRICFGSSGVYWQIGSPNWCRRTDEAFDALHRAGHLPWLKIHMLRGLSLAGDRWPFASADSVNVARNYKDSNADPERMARRIDAVQCPVRWTPSPTQEALFA